MAELALLSAVKRIGIALGGEAQQQLSSIFKKEVELISQLPSSLNRIKREFAVMHAFLSNLDMEDENSALQVWLEQVRKVAYDVEDALDEMVLRVGEEHIKSCYYIFRNMIGKPQNILSWRRIASKLKELENDLAHVTLVKDRWINITQEAAGYANLSQVDAFSSFSGEDLVDIDEIKANLKKLIRLLGEEETVDSLPGLGTKVSWLTRFLNVSSVRSSSIIALWGPSGVGKTTLLHHAYNSEKKNFKCDAFVSVLLFDTADDLLRSMLKQLYGKVPLPDGIDNKLYRELEEIMQTFLEKKKYLIILDDVKEKRYYLQIEKALIKNNLGSKIILTTDNEEVAKLAEEKYRVKIDPLQESKAKELLLKKTLRTERFPRELDDTATQIVKRCGGLPQAIVTVAGLLSLRRKTKAEWDNMDKQLDRLLGHDRLLGDVKLTADPWAKLTSYLSFKCLPRHLKNCFLFCGIFPKNFMIRRKRLIKLWIAEGFIEESGMSTPEEVADDYLNELVRRHMLIIVDRYEGRRVKGYRMRPFMQEVIMSFAQKESFSFLSGNLNRKKLDIDTRHLSMHKSGRDHHASIDLPKLRTFMAFESGISLPLLHSVISNSRYLMVLDLQDSIIETIPAEVGQLFNLRYLSLRNTKVKELPKTVGSLGCLQTLDLANTLITKLPKEIAQVKQLRHLIASKVENAFEANFPVANTVSCLSRIQELKMLHTLQGVDASRGLVEKLRELLLLRNLRLLNVRNSHCSLLDASLKKMHFLSGLEIVAEDTEVQLNLKVPHSVLHRLQMLVLHVRLFEDSARSLIGDLGKNISQLYLGCIALKEDSLACLGVLEKLTLLKLSDSYSDEQLHFTAGSPPTRKAFPNLKAITLQNLPNVKKVLFSEGTMGKLEYMELISLTNLMNVPEGIQHVRSLQDLVLCNLHPEFHTMTMQQPRVTWTKL